MALVSGCPNAEAAQLPVRFTSYEVMMENPAAIQKESSPVPIYVHLGDEFQC